MLKRNLRWANYNSFFKDILKFEEYFLKRNFKVRKLPINTIFSYIWIFLYSYLALYPLDIFIRVIKHIKSFNLFNLNNYFLNNSQNTIKNWTEIFNNNNNYYLKNLPLLFNKTTYSTNIISKFSINNLKILLNNNIPNFFKLNIKNIIPNILRLDNFDLPVKFNKYIIFERSISRIDLFLSFEKLLNTFYYFKKYKPNNISNYYLQAQNNIVKLNTWNIDWNTLTTLKKENLEKKFEKKYPNFKKPQIFKNNLDFSINNVKIPGAIFREPVWETLATGWISVDSLMPLGRGQRELIIGDKQTGKTALVIDSIINQKYSFTDTHNICNLKDVVFCIYVGIGQKMSMLAKLSKKLQIENAKHYSIIVAATASDPASLQFLAPYTGCFF